MEKSAVEITRGKLAKKVVRALENRFFEAYYCETKAEAKEKALGLIPDGALIAWGGSVSAEQIGLLAEIKTGTYSTIDREKGITPEERAELMRQSLLCDVYISGTNAISEDGQLVNVDGNGNRVAAITYGPKSVIIIAGMNKITKTVQDAVVRARNIAAPINKQRFPAAKTGCAESGSCSDCSTADCICNTIITTRGCRPAKRIKVILVGETLGF